MLMMAIIPFYQSRVMYQILDFIITLGLGNCLLISQSLIVVHNDL